ncbi:MAG: tetratricopeptide repeat protein [Desulfosporosinus sp.]|nr:tetratricopeptide repeat protein [Desulfosporosinus sp.]
MSLSDGTELVLKSMKVKMDNVLKLLNVYKEYYIGRTFSLVCGSSTVKIRDMKQAMIQDEDEKGKMYALELLMEYGGESLEKLSGKQKECDAVKIMYQLLDTLKLMDEQDFAHFDIKLQNVTWDGERLKLIDFATTVPLRRSDVSQKFKKYCDRLTGYTKSYAPPEMLKAQENEKLRELIIPEKYDIFSFGITFMKMLILKCNLKLDAVVEERVGYNEDAHKEYVDQVRSALSKIGKGHWKNFIAWCLEYDPEKRPTYNEAKAAFKKVVADRPDLCSALKLDDFDKDDVAKNVNNRILADTYYQLKEFDTAVWYYQKCLNEPQSTQSKFFQIYNGIGNSYAELGENDKAEPYLLKAAEIAKNGKAPSAIRTMSNNLGIFYVYTGKYIEAANCFERSVEIMKETKKDDPELASAYNNLAVACYHAGNYQVAIDIATKGLEIQSKLPGVKPNETIAFSYEILWAVYNAIGHREEARNYCEKEIKIFKTLYGPDDPRLATSYDNLGAQCIEVCNHCMIHREKPVEYVCPACKNIPMCGECERVHGRETGHVSENCKDIGLALMRKHIQYSYGKQEKEFAEGRIKCLEELKAGLFLEINKFQSICVQIDEQCNKMRKLDSEKRYAELYFYARSLSVSGAKSEATIEELNKRLLNIFDTASEELKKVSGKIAVGVRQHKPMLSTYTNEEVFMFQDETFGEEEKAISALKNAGMLRFTAIYIESWGSIGDHTASELTSYLQKNPLSALYLEGNYISDAGAEALAQAAFRNKPLFAFCLDGTRISDTGARAVAVAAQDCRSLTTFYLDGSNISDFGAHIVAKAMKDCPISAFCLCGGGISDSGAIAVAKAMKDCPLSAFSIRSKEISDAGAMAVAKELKYCPLSAFSICSNAISDAGATAVMDILSSGCDSTLSAFCLGSNRISDLCTKRMADAIRNFPKISAFYLDSKPLSGETLVYILESMASVSTIRRVNLCIGEMRKEQMDSCLTRLRQIGVGIQLKLRFLCDSHHAEAIYEKLTAEWKGKFAEFRTAISVVDIFKKEVMIGMPQ